MWLSSLANKSNGSVTPFVMLSTKTEILLALGLSWLYDVDALFLNTCVLNLSQWCLSLLQHV